ncbi:MAG: TPM domain-containing protein [Bifidobacteriaceae bacterium]|nr:TPM domain-containing protein [Bifidobacteriaceae bacterium]
MSLQSMMSQKQAPVVECDLSDSQSRHSNGVDFLTDTERGVVPKTLSIIFSMVLAVVLAVGFFAAPSAAMAADEISTNITDTENLLGGDVGKVSDAMDDVKSKTGVTLTLLYLATFDTKEKPAKWASAQLESLSPAKNTVMLAVASEDGNLAVVVSKNSDAWLRNQSTVDALSQAAVDPIIKHKTPDWSGSAIALADAIETKKADVDSAPMRRAILIGSIVAGLALAALIAWLVLRYLRKRKTRRRHAAPSDHARRGHVKNRGAKASEDSADSADSAEADESEHPTPAVSEISGEKDK